MADNSPSLEIKQIKDILQEDLWIPSYQRAYSWQERHVQQLLNDVIFFSKNRPDIAYRLGTIILHEKDNKKYIVDGQQRLITLNIIQYILGKKEANILYENDQNFENSKKSIFDNYKVIELWAKDKHENDLKNFEEFLFKNCQVVVITLNDLGEAFQFFDTQNSRGKDLYPHDILKAYHLRRMSSEPDEKQFKVDTMWQEMGEERLNKLFEEYLYHIKRWSQDKNVYKEPFNKDKVDYFKGIDPATHYHQLSKTAQITSLVYAAFEMLQKLPTSLKECISKELTSIYQIDMPVVEGYHFFKMVQYCDKLFGDWVEEYAKVSGKEKAIKFQQCNYVPKWLKDSYDGAERTGDKAVRNLFDNALVYYIDKFGERNLHQAIRYLVNYCYSLRFEFLSLNLGQVDGNRKKWFTTLRFAIDERDVPIAKSGWNGKIHEKTDEVKKRNIGILKEIFGSEDKIDLNEIKNKGLYDVSK